MVPPGGSPCPGGLRETVQRARSAPTDREGTRLLPTFASMRSLNMRTLPCILVLALASLFAAPATAQNTIYGYAIGNWRNGPTVEFSPLFETTERFTPAQLIEWVREQWPGSFTDTTEIDVLLFGDIEGGELDRRTLKAKYGMRNLPVHLIGAEAMPSTAPAPARKPSVTAAPR